MLWRLHCNGQLAHGRLLAVGGGAARPRPVRDGGRHRTRWRLQPAARRCSWWLRARLQRRELLTECTLAGSVGSEPAALPHP